MKQVLQNFKSGDLDVHEVPRPELRDDGILVKNHYSAVSAGTEEAVINLAEKNLLGKALERPDLAKQVINKARNDGLMPTYRAVKGRLKELSPLGYSCCGEVIEVGRNVDEFSVGDMVACGGAGYANHASVVYVPENLAVQLPEGVDPKDASFATIGAIAMQGVRRADISPGENVAVIGLGLIGLLTTQILNAYGTPVLGVDIDPGQVARAEDLGLIESAVIGQDDVEAVAQNFSDSHGVDAVIITASTDSDQPVEMAGDIAREHGRISAVGDVGMDIPRNKYYDKELDFRISRSYGPGRYDKTYEEKGLSYPIEHVRWTENRNMGEFLRLIGEERINLSAIRTHTFPISDALTAYELIRENSDDENYLGVLLEYDTDAQSTQTVDFDRTAGHSASGDLVSVGLIGGGNFAKTTILPVLKKIDNVELTAVCSATGKTATDIAQDHQSAYATTNYEEITRDENIDLVIVATRNNLHAEIATNALKHGKNTFVEKPLALTEDELREVLGAESESTGRLMVGFNRRFSSVARDLHDDLKSESGPIMVNYRVNAESVPSDHWIHDPEEGGGRILSEVCHFVDLAQFLANSPPTRVFASSPPPGGGIMPRENANVVIDFEDGSSAMIQYTALGDQSLPKERVEVFGGNRSHVIDNFNYGRFGIRQDKGHKAEYESFVESIQNGSKPPVPIEEIAYSSLATIKVLGSNRNNAPEAVHISDVYDTTQNQS